jgi:hypothetical protein
MRLPPTIFYVQFSSFLFCALLWNKYGELNWILKWKLCVIKYQSPCIHHSGILNKQWWSVRSPVTIRRDYIVAFRSLPFARKLLLIRRLVTTPSMIEPNLCCILNVMCFHALFILLLFDRKGSNNKHQHHAPYLEARQNVKIKFINRRESCFWSGY